MITSLFRAAIFACLTALLFIRPVDAQEQFELLPKETVAAFSIIDGDKWQQRWQSTSLSKFFEDPSVRQYLEQVTNGARSEAAWLRMVLPGDDPVKVTGQFTYAVIGTGSGLDHLIQIESSSPTEARNWVDAISNRLKDQRFVAANTAEDSIRVLQSESGKNTIAFSVMGRRGLACTNPAVLKQLLSTQYKPLAVTKEFQTTVKKALQQNADSLFWWFVRPIELSLGDPTNQQSVKNFNMIRAQGFDAVRAIGGAGTIDSATNRVQSTGFLSLHRPLRLAARLLDLSDEAIPKIPAWTNAATSSGYLNIKTQQFLEHYSTLFDALYGEGESGVFTAVLDDLKNRNDGPKVDLQQDMIRFLEQRVFFATVQGQKSAPRIIGIPTTSPQKVAAAIEKLFAGDSRAQNQSGSNHVTWKIMPLEDGYGIREPFVISVRSNTLFVAPNSAVLDYLSQNAGAVEGSYATSNQTAKLAYRIDFERFAGRFLAQLRNKQLSKSAEDLLTRLNLKQSVLAADPAKLPPFEQVRSSFESKLNLIGQADGQDWKLTIETK